MLAVRCLTGMRDVGEEVVGRNVEKVWSQVPLMSMIRVGRLDDRWKVEVIKPPIQTGWTSFEVEERPCQIIKPHEAGNG